LVEVANALEEETIEEEVEEVLVVAEVTIAVTVTVRKCTVLPVVSVARVVKFHSDHLATSQYSVVTVSKANETVAMTVATVVIEETEALKREILSLALMIDVLVQTKEVQNLKQNSAR